MPIWFKRPDHVAASRRCPLLKLRLKPVNDHVDQRSLPKGDLRRPPNCLDHGALDLLVVIAVRLGQAAERRFRGFVERFQALVGRSAIRLGEARAR